MKKQIKIIIVMLVLALQSCAVMTTENTPAITKIIEVEGESKNQLYVKANNWVVETFKDAKSVIQFTDKESGTITGKFYLGGTSIKNKFNSPTASLIKIIVKDNASKITIDPPSYTYYKGGRLDSQVKEKTEEEINLLMDTFKLAMQKKENSNW